ncbi:hypothetical protein B0E53_06800 [Micromonospora sp. MH33]|nr:hypothetical protein B0E53_06800 [Micromonospora sp. MH33]
MTSARPASSPAAPRTPCARRPAGWAPGWRSTRTSRCPTSATPWPPAAPRSSTGPCCCPATGRASSPGWPPSPTTSHRPSWSVAPPGVADWPCSSPGRARSAPAWAARRTGPSRPSPPRWTRSAATSTRCCRSRSGRCCSPPKVPPRRRCWTGRSSPKPASSPSRWRCSAWSSRSAWYPTWSAGTPSARSPPRTWPGSSPCPTPAPWSRHVAGSCRPCRPAVGCSPSPRPSTRWPPPSPGWPTGSASRPSTARRPWSSPGRSTPSTRSTGPGASGVCAAGGCGSATPSTARSWRRCSTSSAPSSTASPSPPRGCRSCRT